MSKKQFKAESKKLLDLMINSIYTNKEIFLRELISNASDAMDKLYFRSLTDKNVDIDRDEFKIEISVDKDNRTITIEDNGCGMNEENLEINLGTIAKSDTLDFREQNKDKALDIIGQFGVGFYSAFMVSDRIEVVSKAYGDKQAYKWESSGAEGYTIEKADKDDYGTIITLHVKEDTENEDYTQFLNDSKIKELIKKYSDYIKYPINMDVEEEQLKEGTEDEYEKVISHETINSMQPIWKKDKKDITEEEYNEFYKTTFYDYENPIKTIHTSVEGLCSYNALLYIPNHAPYDFYTKEYKKGLQLYSNGVLIMDKCEDLLPDYFSFVRGLVDSSDLSLNISREILQQDHQVKLIAKNIEKKIKKELQDMLENDRENYEKFFEAFGIQLKFSTYNNFGMDKDAIKDLLLFYSSKQKKLITIKEYIDNIKEGQDKIYYACGESKDKIDLMPQIEQFKEKDFDVLYLTDYVDEFTMQALMEYEGKKFTNISSENLNLDSEEDKKKIEKENEDNKDMLELMKKTLNDNVHDVKFTNRLKNHPVCLSTEGPISIEMEKVMSVMPTDQKIKASAILEINESHPIANKIKELYKSDTKELEEYTKVLYAQARLIEGLPLDNPTEISNIICNMISK
jgi:molecular chaperone HtpG